MAQRLLVPMAESDMRKTMAFFPTFLVSGLLCLPVAAQVKDDLKQAGHNTAEAGKDVRDATKDSAKKSGKAIKKRTKKTTHAAATKTEEGADKVREKTK
jgi:hypothetical protein